MRVHNVLGVDFPIDDPTWIADLVLQRTGPLSVLGGQDALGEWFRTGNRAPLESLCSNEVFVTRFLDIVAGEALAEAKPLCELVRGRKRVCSIGPGNGLVEYFLLLLAGVHEILLIDIEATSQHAHGFEKTGSGYASLEKTKDFMVMNGVAPSSILLCNPQKTTVPRFEFDMLLSIMSMGFHYPCDEYVSFAKENCESTGCIIFDKRKHVVDAGYARLIQDFSVEVLSENHKWQRVCLTPHQA